MRTRVKGAIALMLLIFGVASASAQRNASQEEEMLRQAWKNLKPGFTTDLRKLPFFPEERTCGDYFLTELLPNQSGKDVLKMLVKFDIPLQAPKEKAAAALALEIDKFQLRIIETNVPKVKILSTTGPGVWFEIQASRAEFIRAPCLKELKRV